MVQRFGKFQGTRMEPISDVLHVPSSTRRQQLHFEISYRDFNQRSASCRDVLHKRLSLARHRGDVRHDVDRMMFSDVFQLFTPYIFPL
jgi:hypothetical protein